jgi:predicted nucleic-acid-binding Zn-ribbon protein
MDVPTLKEEKVLITWSSIYNTKHSSIFIFKYKNKKIIHIYIWVCGYVCFWRRKPSWSLGAKFEFGLEIRSSFWVRVRGRCSTGEVGLGEGDLSPSFTTWEFPCPLFCRCQHWTINRCMHIVSCHLSLRLGLKDTHTRPHMGLKVWVGWST